MRGGDWTLQRLAQEVAPPAGDFAAAEPALDVGAGAEVILETQIDALDITILKGGGDEVGLGAATTASCSRPDAPEVLDFYAHRSPIFMAARFDATRAASSARPPATARRSCSPSPPTTRGCRCGSSASASTSASVVDADVFLLTDEQPDAARRRRRAQPRPQRAGVDGLLLDDLRSDNGMEWVPEHMWFTYLQVDATAGSSTTTSRCRLTPA